MKILKMEYLSNHRLDLTQIRNLSLGDQTKIENLLQWRQSPMEYDLQILKDEYLSNHLLYLPQLLNLSIGDQNQI